MNAILPTPQLFSVLLLKGDEMNAMLVKLAFEENQAPACTFRVCDGVGALEFLRGAPHFADVPRPDLSACTRICLFAQGILMGSPLHEKNSAL